ncbi:DNA polymerase III subunit delta [Bacteroidota bacterium]
MTFENILSELKNKIYRPFYFLMGDEPFFIDKITDYIHKHVLSESERPFNETIFYGKDTDIPAIINSARRFPMMSNYQVVIVREAQEIKDIEELSVYLDAPLKSTILVINYKYKSLDKRKKFYKIVQEKGILFESKKFYDDKIPDWIRDYVKSAGYEIDLNSTMIMTEYLGNDLIKISNEIDKLLICLPEESRKITPEQVESNIGISKDFNNFELQKALIQRNKFKSYQIADYFSKNQKNNPFALTIISLFSFFSKLMLYSTLKISNNKEIASKLKIHPFFVSDYQRGSKVFEKKKIVQIISLLREYDLKSKGVNNVSTSNGELLKELLYKIFN